jgi:hypothetical protein
MNKEKIQWTVNKIVASMDRMSFTADESICLIKCLERVLVVQAIEKDLVVTSLTKLKEVVNGRAPIDSVLPENAT